jgi:N-acetylmuramoyl-L-alanine amidase
MKPLLGAATFIFVCVLGILFHTILTAPEARKNVISKSEYNDHKRQIACLADNIYYEAGNQPIQGKKAVAYVTLNRARAGRWPSDVCSIVYQKDSKLCQFSWVCENRKSKNNAVWEQSYNIARHVWYKYDDAQDPTHGATFFHATYVRPQWKYQKTIQIGDHIFYK